MADYRTNKFIFTASSMYWTLQRKQQYFDSFASRSTNAGPCVNKQLLIWWTFAKLLELFFTPDIYGFLKLISNPPRYVLCITLNFISSRLYDSLCQGGSVKLLTKYHFSEVQPLCILPNDIDFVLFSVLDENLCK